MLLMAVSSATLSVAQNVAKIGSTEYATLQEAVDSVAQGKKGYIYILADASFDNLSIEGKQIIINLQNHTVTGNKIDVYGTEGTDTYLKILDSKAEGLSVDKNNNYSVSYTASGTLELTGSIRAYNGAAIKVESGTVVSTQSVALFAVGDETGQKDIASSIEITGGYVKAQEFGASPQGRGARVTVNGFAVIESLDNAAVAGNGSGVQTTTITINGGTLVSTSDYAIYHPQFGTLTINDGAVVYGAAGAIAMKRGNLVVNGGTMTSKGIGDTGNWGDGTGNLGKAALNFCAPYGDVTAIIKAGTITAEGDAVLIDAKPTEGKTVTLAIEGGTYSSDVSKYCSPGFTATPNADGTYGITHVGDGVLVVYDKSYTQIAAGGTVDIDMDQVNKILVAEAGVNGVNTTLTKNYNNTGWYSFFVPFDFTLTDEMLKDFEFATLYATALENGNGSPVISYKMAKAGDKIAAFFPCLIKAKATGEQKLNVGEVDYKSTKGVTPKDCSSITELYTFYPVMENTYIAAKHGYYLNSEQNSFVYNAHPEAHIRPLRYYMTIQDRATMSYIEPANGGASKAKICVIGEDEPTGITDLVDDGANASGKVYNLQGVVVGNTTEGLPKGVYIKNGRKIIVK